MRRNTNTFNKIIWFSHSKTTVNQNFYLLQAERATFQWKYTALLMKWWWLEAFQLFPIRKKANRLTHFKSFTLFLNCAKLKHMLHTLLALTSSIYNVQHFTHFLCIKWTEVINSVLINTKRYNIRYFLPAVGCLIWRKGINLTREVSLKADFPSKVSTMQNDFAAQNVGPTPALCWGTTVDSLSPIWSDLNPRYLPPKQPFIQKCL